MFTKIKNFYKEEKEWCLGLVSFMLISLFPGLYKAFPDTAGLVLLIFTWLPCLWVASHYCVKGSMFISLIRKAEEHFAEQKAKQIEYHKAMNELIKK